MVKNISDTLFNFINILINGVGATGIEKVFMCTNVLQARFLLFLIHIVI